MAKPNLAPILERLNQAGGYHPFSADVFTDWAQEAGDVVSIKKGDDTYASPIHVSRMKWAGKPRVQINADGNETRDAIAKVSRKKYGRGGSGMYNDNRIYHEMSDYYGALTSKIEMTESHLIVEFDQMYNGLNSRITATASIFEVELNDVYNGLSSDITATASVFQVKLNDTYNGLNSRITATASVFQVALDDVYNGLNSDITATASVFQVNLNNAYQGLSSSLTNTASIFQVNLNNAYQGLSSSISSTASTFQVNLNNAYQGLSSTIKSTASTFQVNLNNAYQGLSSTIKSTASTFQVNLDNAYNGLNSRITSTASSLQVNINNAYQGLSSNITATSSKLQTSINNSYNGLSSRITQTASSWDARVSGVTDAYGNVTAASIAVAINNGGSSATINASQIYLLGDTIANTITADYINNKIATIGTLSGIAAHFSGNVTSDAGVLCRAIYVGSGQNWTDISDGIKEINISLSGNTYTLQYKKFSDTQWQNVTQTFSRATSLSGAWSGDGTATSNTYTVTATPQENTNSVTISERISGNAQYSNFVAEFGTYSGNNFTRRGYTQGYLVINGNNVDVNSASDGSGSVYASIDCQSIYNAGYDSAQMKGEWSTTTGVTNANKITISKVTSGGSTSPLSYVISAGATITWDSTSNKFKAVAKAKVDGTQRGDADEALTDVISIQFNALSGTGKNRKRTVSILDGSTSILTSGDLTDYGDGYSAGWTAARGKVSYPTTTPATIPSTITFKFPSSTVGASTAASRTYTIYNDGDNAIKLTTAVSGVAVQVAGFTHGKWDAGYDDALGKIIYPSEAASDTEVTSFVLKVPNAARNGQDDKTFTLNKGETPAASGYASVSLAGVGVVGRISIGNWYTAGYDDAQMKGEWSTTTGVTNANKITISKVSSGGSTSPLAYVISAGATVTWDSTSSKFKAVAKAKVDGTQRGDADEALTDTISIQFNALSGSGSSRKRTVSILNGSTSILTSGDLTDYGDGYSAGWGAAQGQVSYPTTTPSTMIDYVMINYPKSTVGGTAGTQTYTVSNDGDNAVKVTTVVNGSSVKVAGFTHGKWNAGHDDGWTAAYNTVNATGYFPSTEPSVMPGYISTAKVNSTVDGAKVDYKYYVTSDANAAYIRYGNASTGAKVAKITHNQYDNGWTAAYDSVNLSGYFPNTQPSSIPRYINTAKVNSTVGGSSELFRYYVTSADNTAYIRLGGTSSSYPIVARYVHYKWRDGRIDGWTAAYNSVNVSGFFPSEEPATFQQYISTAKPNATTDGTRDTYGYYVTVDQDAAYIRCNSTVGPKVAKVTHSYWNDGYDDALGKINYPSEAASDTEVTSFVLKVPNAARNGQDDKTFTLNKGETPAASGYASVSLAGVGVVGRISIGNWYTAGYDDAQMKTEWQTSTGVTNANKLKISKVSSGGSTGPLEYVISAGATIVWDSTNYKYKAVAKAKVDGTQRGDAEEDLSGVISIAFNAISGSCASAKRTVSVLDGSTTRLTSGNLTDYGDGYTAAMNTIVWPGAIQPSETERTSFGVTVPTSTGSETLSFSLVKGSPSANGGYATLKKGGDAIARISLNNWWTTAYAAGAPVSASLGSHVGTGTTWTVVVKKGDNGTVNCNVDMSNVYTAARSGYYLPSQLDIGGSFDSLGFGNLTIKVAGSGGATLKTMNQKVRAWFVTSSTQGTNHSVLPHGTILKLVYQNPDGNEWTNNSYSWSVADPAEKPYTVTMPSGYAFVSATPTNALNGWSPTQLSGIATLVRNNYNTYVCIKFTVDGKQRSFYFATN